MGEDGEGPIRIRYAFRFPDESAVEHEVVIDRDTLEIAHGESEPPDWCLLDHGRCAHCPLSAQSSKYCPAARTLAELAPRFRDRSAHTITKTEVTTQERTFLREGPFQHALQGLFGLVMATSGCPHFEFLKPMARFHLPFATVDETVVRAVSMHLLERYVRARRGEGETFDLAGLTQRYAGVAKVNRDMMNRLSAVGGLEGNRNALVTLDVFGKMLRMEIEDDLPEIARIFPRTHAA